MLKGNMMHERQNEDSIKKNENVISININTPNLQTTDKNADDNRRESKQKEARSFLREEFLRILFTITNKPVKIKFAKTKEPLDAIFAGSDFTFSTITVKDLKTPIGKEPQSLLRTSDITKIVYESKL